MRLSRILFLLCTLLLATTAPESITHPRPTKDHALLFAIQDYDNWTDLKNPIRDAEAIAQQLRGNYEFDDLKIVTNPTLETIQATLNQYLTKTYGPDDQLFIFFSGHGAFNDLTAEGFFIPKGGLKNDPFQNSYLPLTRLERIISNIPCAHILLTIDACYSGTFNESIALDKSDPTNPTWRRPGVDPGNGDSKAAWINSKLSKRSRICITSGGKERTSDGIEHSPLTEAFLKGLANPGEDAILTVDELVAGLKNLQPGPKTFSFGTHQSDGSFLFIQKEEVTTHFKLQPYEQRQPETQAWTTAKNTNTPAAYLDYLQKFPQGAFREEASKALAIVEEDQEWELALLRNTPTAYQAYLKRFPTGRYAPEAKKNLQPTATPDSDRDGVPDANDRCPDRIGPASNNGCPTPPLVLGMVLVQGGIFQMGDVMGDKENDNETVHNVTVSSFFLAKNELTFDEFDAFCKATSRELPSDSGWGRGKRPVINVDWYDAIEYCNWRSSQEGLQVVYSINKNKKDSKNGNKSDAKKWLVTINRTANGYRLPTEAEWEYAARQGGRKVRFGNGKDTADIEEINFSASLNSGEWYDKPTDSYYRKTIPVGSFSPNTLELFDMSGNVLEWCEDWYDAYPSNTSNDPRGPTTGSYRVMRGGSHYNAPAGVRVAVRFYNRPDYSRSLLGFRLARAATTL